MKKILSITFVLFCLFATVSCVHECNCTVVEQSPVRIDTFYNVSMQTRGECSEFNGTETHTISSTNATGEVITHEVSNTTICE